MLRTLWHRGRLIAARSAWIPAALVSTALAQPPEAPPGPPPGGPPAEHRDPLRGALDANRDFELDADEIASAPEAIKKLDKNGDGKLDREELRPPMGPPPGGRGPEGRPPEGRPRRPGEFGGRPPRDGEPGRHPREGRDGPPPPPRDGETPSGPPRPRDGDTPEGPPPPREGGRPGAGGPGDRPSPERFLERAKEFDADGDGKLDESELRKMAEAMAERMRGRGPDGGGGPPRDGGDRPERPRRPE